MISASVSKIAFSVLMALSFDVQAVFDMASDRIAEIISMFEAIEESGEIAEYDDTYVYYDDTYVYYDDTYIGGSSATTTYDLLNGQGRAYGDDGTSYTYYNHDIGYGALDIPGETFDDDGVSHDADGYIVVAADGYEYGEVIDTPYGEAKVYDRGSGYGTVDIYTNR